MHVSLVSRRKMLLGVFSSSLSVGKYCLVDPILFLINVCKNLMRVVSPGCEVIVAITLEGDVLC